MKKFSFAFLLCILMTFSLTLQSWADNSIGWYTVRNAEHKQPRLDGTLSFIDKYDAYYVDKAHGDECEEKVIYLTFDAGYENGNIEKILDALKEENVSGSFFILGNLVVKNTDLVKRMVEEGHTVCNHTFCHPDMTKLSSFEEFSRELEHMEDIFREYIGCDISKILRPPEGKFNETVLGYAKDMGYKTVFWSFAYEDWNNDRQMSPHAAMKKIKDNLHNGEIMLLHPTSDTNAAIMKELIVELKAEGYRFATLSELGR